MKFTIAIFSMSILALLALNQLHEQQVLPEPISIDIMPDVHDYSTDE